MSQQKLKPTTDDEWTIHALNIHGTFFERWCERVIRDTHGFEVVSTNYPVEFPPPENGIRGRESALDIRALRRDYHRWLTLVIECKKNNPDYVNWVFFPSRSGKSIPTVSVPVISNASLHGTSVGWEVKTGRSKVTIQDLPFTDEARETKGAYQTAAEQKAGKTLTKTSNAAVTEAAHQVAIAAQAILLEEIEHSSRRGKEANATTPMRWNMQAVIPIVVTTARLFICNFDPGDVDSTTGEIPLGKTELVEHPYLTYTYPLPRHLQHIPEDAAAALEPYQLEEYVRMQIIIVHSAKLQEFLEMITRNAEYFFL